MQRKPPIRAGWRLAPALGPVAAGADEDGFDAEPRMPIDERIADQRGLRAREGAPARAETQHAAMRPRQNLPGARPVLAQLRRAPPPPTPPDPVGRLGASRHRA